MIGELRQQGVEHHQIQARGPAEALEPRQELAGRNGLAMLVEQARQHLVVQHLSGIGGVDHRLHVLQEAPLLQCTVQQAMPVVALVVGGGLLAVLDECPVTAAVADSLGQGGIQRAVELAAARPRCEGGDADMRHRRAIAGTGLLQRQQCAAQLLGQLLGFMAIDTAGQQGEFAAAITRQQEAPLAGLLQLLGHRLEQLVGTLAADALVQPGQVVDPQQHQHTAAGALLSRQAGLQVEIEIAAVGQAGQAVLVGFGVQFLAT
ncbi:hypothetical protein SRABI70_04845 [Pseudomonas sp. Bi70]|nr:hypothetical protein SRABI70_04845 [Pseudomonas sp. Bi70]